MTFRHRLASWLHPEQAAVISHNAWIGDHVDRQAEVIDHQNALIQLLRDDNHSLNAEMTADRVEHEMFVSRHGRCLHPSREDDQK